MSLIKCLDQLLNAAIKFDGKHNTHTSSSTAIMFSRLTSQSTTGLNFNPLI